MSSTTYPGAPRQRHASPATDPDAVLRRARSMWPRIDREALRRTGGDVDRVATLVERRSGLPRESIIGILCVPEISDAEAATWFG